MRHAGSTIRACMVAWLVAMGSGVTAQPGSGSDALTISGTAAYRQRMAMPPEAVLTVRIEDVSRADAPARVVAEVREPFGARQVPIPFALSVPRSAIEPRARYALRATISVGGQLRFTTDTLHAVLTPGAPTRFNLLLVPASTPAHGPAAASASPAALPGLALPASFAGVLPCADCPGIAHTLTLRADGLYRLRRTYLGKPGEPVAELGRWSADATRRELVLGQGPDVRRYALVDGETLRQLDRSGLPIATAANLTLRRIAQVDAIAEPLRWRGEFRYLADAASFSDCASGLRWPVAMAGDYQALERHYGSVRPAPGAPLLVRFDGRLETRAAMEGPPREHIVVDRLVDADAGARCESHGPGVAAASLKDTDWKLIELDGRPVAMAAAQQREARITLADAGARVFGFCGCNNLIGAYVLDGGALRFTQLAGTMMACPPPLMALESQLHQALRATDAYRIDGQRLSLLAGTQTVARFEAVYLR
jgi:uncharacterized lipoprotein YbaY/heat shock protein HslJ/uncharacterized lipoprotein NlpE involved in copper resistance